MLEYSVDEDGEILELVELLEYSVDEEGETLKLLE